MGKLGQTAVSGIKNKSSTKTVTQPLNHVNVIKLRPPPPMSARARLSSALHTGVTAIDALAPVGRGASMLLVGVGETRFEGSSTGGFREVIRESTVGI